MVWRRISSRRSARWSAAFLLLLGLVALSADFLANDKPLYCQLEGSHYFPVFREWAVAAGWADQPEPLSGVDWYQLPYESAVWPLIPYAAGTIDSRNLNFRSPGGPQQVSSPQFRHWLGTDQVGRDVAAGLIAGTRTTVLIGLVTMSIAFVLGILAGLLAGYFGNEGLRFSRSWWGLQFLALLLSVVWWISPGLTPFRAGPAPPVVSWEKVAFPLLLFFLAHICAGRLSLSPWWQKKRALPVDAVVMRTIETINAMPSLFLLIAGIAILPEQSLFWVMVWIGLLSWTGIARFTRAETLKVRGENYLDAARLLGISEIRVIWRHLLPNTLSPVLIALAFGFSGVILLEAYLSYLGLGAAPDEVSWGSMIRMATNRPGAWWLALFPGLAIFLTVGAFNLLGEELSESLGN